MKWDLTADDTKTSVDIQTGANGNWRVALDDLEQVEVLVRPAGPNRWIVEMGGQRHLISGVFCDGMSYVQFKGWNLRYLVSDPRNAFIDASDVADQGQIATQMPGIIVRTLVSVGDSVTKGQPVIVVEAMKMENELKAPMDGTVSAILVTDGEAVDSGALLIEISEQDDEA